MGFISRWLSNHRCFKVQYGAVIVTIIVISLFGRGYKFSGPVIEDIRNIDPKQQENDSEVVMVQTVSSRIETITVMDWEFESVVDDFIDNNYIREYNATLHDYATKTIPKKKLYVENLASNIPREIVTMDKKAFLNKHKDVFPILSDIRISNKYWQYFNVSTGVDFYLFNAFYDHRKMFQNNAFVRVLAMVSHIDKDFDLYCKLWFRKKKYKSMSAIAIMRSIIYRSDSALNTYIISCEVPFEGIDDIPFAVSLVEHRRNKATNVLRVINNELEGNDSKEDFAICHKGLDFPFYDNSLKLVEWIELSSIMGASKIFFYEFHVHPNISKVLQYYTEKGLVEVTPLTLPGDQPNTPKELNEYIKSHYMTQIGHEKLPYNDCYFKNMNKYKYILNIDIDEMLIPQNTHTWKELIAVLKANLTDNREDLQSQYEFERFTSLDNMRKPHGFADDIPKYMYFLQHIYRGNHFNGGPKSLFDTDIVIATSTHKTSFCKSKCTHYKVPTNVALIIHYRSSCKGQGSTCDLRNTVRDTVIWKYKEELIKRTTNVLKILRLI